MPGVQRQKAHLAPTPTWPKRPNASARNPLGVREGGGRSAFTSRPKKGETGTGAVGAARRGIVSLRRPGSRPTALGCCLPLRGLSPPWGSLRSRAPPLVNLVAFASHGRAGRKGASERTGGTQAGGGGRDGGGPARAERTRAHYRGETPRFTCLADIYAPPEPETHQTRSTPPEPTANASATHPARTDGDRKHDTVQKPADRTQARKPRD